MNAVPPPVVDSVTVPPPVRLTAPEICRNVLLAAALIWIWPAFPIFPATTREVLLLMIRLSSLSMVRLPTLTLMSRVTCEATALPLSMQTFVLVLLGTPPLHFAGLLQLPAPPCQMVLLAGQMGAAFGEGLLDLFAAPIKAFKPVIFETNAPPGAAVGDEAPEPVEAEEFVMGGVESNGRLARGKSTEVVAPEKYAAPSESSAMPRASSAPLPPR